MKVEKDDSAPRRDDGEFLQENEIETAGVPANQNRMPEMEQMHQGQNGATWNNPRRSCIDWYRSSGMDRY